LLAYLEQLHSNGGPVSFQKHASTVLILLAHWLPILPEPKHTLFESTLPGVGQSSERLDRLFENFNVTAQEGFEEKKARAGFKNRASERPDVCLEARTPLKARLWRLVIQHRCRFVGRQWTGSDVGLAKVTDDDVFLKK
jgi:hypothetical protein